jgi:iron complex outermembrane receptor protein
MKMKGHYELRLFASATAIAMAVVLAPAAYAQAAGGATGPEPQAGQANPGDALAADAGAPGAVTDQISDPAAQVPDAAGQPTVASKEDIIVTGTAIRGVAPVGSATVNVTRDVIIQSGVRDASSLITQLPQGSGQGATLGNSSGRSAGVNLRGLGNNATLLLFDGHRTVAQGVQTLVPDPNTIPFGAIERVEVVTDGASAVYGSDAVAGVVNYIFRRPFDGGEFSARYTNTIYDEGSFNGVLGKTWDGGGILVAGTYEKNSRVRQGSISQLRADLSPFGGNDSRLQGTTFFAAGQNGALINGSTVYGLPAGLNGRTPTTAEVQALRGTPALVDASDYADYYTRRERMSLLVRVQQDLGSLGELSVTGILNRRTNFATGSGDGAFQSVAIAVPTNSPYYVPGLGAGSQSIVYNFRLNNPDRELNREDYENTRNLLIDYRVPLFGDFRLSAAGGIGTSYGCAVCQPQPNTILTSTIATPATASRFNPYLQGEQPGAEGIFGVFIQKVRNNFLDFLPKIDGSLLTLPGGNLRVALGGEITRSGYHQQSDYTLNPTTTLTVFRKADSVRTVKSAFAEAYVPIFSADNAIFAFRKLDLSLAIRHDNYSDFGSTTNPKVGVTWKPMDDLQLRGSYGTSFRAPTQAETNFNVVGAANRTFIPNNLGNPAIPVTNASNGTTLILNSTFRFAQLRPETAKIFSLGGDYTPSYVPGLRFGVTYYSVDYKDRIASLPNPATALSNPATFALYQDFFTIAPQPGTCVNGSVNGNPGAPQYTTYNPAYLPYLNAPGSYPPTTANDCQLVGILDAATRNLGRVKQSGLDFTLNYAHEFPFATLSFDGAFTKVLQLKRNLLPGAPLFDALDRIGEQLSERGRFSAGLTKGPFSGNVAANYLGSYLNNQTPTVAGVKLPDQKVPSWTTFDLNVSFAPEVEGGIFGDTRFTFSARNFTDKDPPVVLSSVVFNGVPTAVDLSNHNVFGRILTFEISKKF